MTLDKNLFTEQLDLLTSFYPADRIEITDTVLENWWGVFKRFESGDFLAGIIACRRVSKRFPALGVLEVFVDNERKAVARVDLSDRMEEHEKKKREEGNFAKGWYSPPEGESVGAQSGDACRVIMEWIATREPERAAEKMRALGEKYPSNKAGFQGMGNLILITSAENGIVNVEPEAINGMS